MSVLASLLAFGAAAYGGGVIAARHAVDFRTVAAVRDEEESENISHPSVEFDAEEGSRYSSSETGRKTPEQSLLIGNTSERSGGGGRDSR